MIVRLHQRFIHTIEDWASIREVLKSRRQRRGSSSGTDCEAIEKGGGVFLGVERVQNAGPITGHICTTPLWKGCPRY